MVSTAHGTCCSPLRRSFSCWDFGQGTDFAGPYGSFPVLHAPLDPSSFGRSTSRAQPKSKSDCSSKIYVHQAKPCESKRWTTWTEGRKRQKDHPLSESQQSQAPPPTGQCRFLGGKPNLEVHYLQERNGKLCGHMWEISTQLPLGHAPSS